MGRYRRNALGVERSICLQVGFDFWNVLWNTRRELVGVNHHNVKTMLDQPKFRAHTRRSPADRCGAEMIRVQFT